MATLEQAKELINDTNTDLSTVEKTGLRKLDKQGIVADEDTNTIIDNIKKGITVTKEDVAIAQMVLATSDSTVQIDGIVGPKTLAAAAKYTPEAAPILTPELESEKLTIWDNQFRNLSLVVGDSLQMKGAQEAGYITEEGRLNISGSVLKDGNGFSLTLQDNQTPANLNTITIPTSVLDNSFNVDSVKARNYIIQALTNSVDDYNETTDAATLDNYNNQFITIKDRYTAIHDDTQYAGESDPRLAKITALRQLSKDIKSLQEEAYTFAQQEPNAKKAEAKLLSTDMRNFRAIVDLDRDKNVAWKFYEQYSKQHENTLNALSSSIYSLGVDTPEDEVTKIGSQIATVISTLNMHKKFYERSKNFGVTVDVKQNGKTWTSNPLDHTWASQMSWAQDLQKQFAQKTAELS